MPDDKNINTFISQIETKKPTPGEVIIVYIGKTPDEALQRICNAVRGSFPDNTVLFLPDNINLKICTKSQLEKLREKISHILEKI